MRRLLGGMIGVAVDYCWMFASLVFPLLIDNNVAVYGMVRYGTVPGSRLGYSFMTAHVMDLT